MEWRHNTVKNSLGLNMGTVRIAQFLNDVQGETIKRIVNEKYPVTRVASGQRKGLSRSEYRPPINSDKYAAHARYQKNSPIPFPAGFSITPFSVIIAVMFAAGVTSNAGFLTNTPSGAT